MDFKKLSSINIQDLKNIDFNELKSIVLSKPSLYINIGVGVLTAIICLSLAKGNMAKAEALKAEGVKLKERMAVVDENDALLKQYRSLRKNFPDYLAGDALIEKVSKTAEKNNLKIMAFSPAAKVEDKFVELTSVNVDITSRNFADVAMFIREIETLPYAIRVKNWSKNASKAVIDSRSRRRRRSQAVVQDDPDLIKASIEIESLKLKQEGKGK